MSQSYSFFSDVSHEVRLFPNSLDHFLYILKHFSNVHRDFPVIHVSGTNGKGSVCTMLNHVLVSHSLNVGLYTSPHVFDYRERIQVNSKKISSEEFEMIFQDVSDKLAQLHTSLSYFEMMTLIAFIYFKKQNVDIVILEVGLGGRLDATNVIDKSLISVITNISLDHTDILGSTEQSIAKEKVAILKKNSILISGIEQEDIKNYFLKIGQKQASDIIFINPLSSLFFKASRLCQSLQLPTFQKMNLAIVLQILEIMIDRFHYSISDDITSSFKHYQHIGRYDKRQLRGLDHSIIPIVFDVAHNTQAISALLDTISNDYAIQDSILLFNVSKDKDVPQMVQQILQYPWQEIWIPQIQYDRVVESKKVRDIFLQHGFKGKLLLFDPSKHNILLKISNKCQKSSVSSIVVTGSFYVVSEMMKWYQSV